jgi:amino acid adenylation domain-containing protein
MVVLDVSYLPDPTVPLESSWDRPLDAWLISHAERSPDRAALLGARTSWTYRELDVRTNRLAHHLLRNGLRPGDLVAITARRSIAFVWSLLGVLRAGCAFTVLDSTFPPVRVQQCLQVARPRIVLRAREHGVVAPVPEGWPVLDLPTLLELAALPSAAPSVHVAADDRAYVAFTSGTTGCPKAIEGTHAPLSHFMPWHAERFGLRADDRFALLSGLAYDAALRDIFVPIVLGGSLCVPDDADFAPEQLAAWLDRREISVLHLTPTLGRLLVDAASACGIRLSTIRYLFFGGELLTADLLGRVRDVAPQATCVNCYGATETPQIMAYHVASSATAGRVPVGRGIDGVQVLVLTELNTLAAVGEMGEVCLRTPYLARGYVGDEALTRERFPVNPFTEIATDRIYRTADLGRYLPDGTVEVCGRLDDQISLRGYRIEPGEIEGILRQHPGVRDAVVLAHEPDPEVKVLAAFIVTSTALSPDIWRAFLSERLPHYMIPSRYTHLERLPVTPGGKIDRAALLGMVQDAGVRTIAAAATVDAVGSPVEHAVAAIWQAVLGRDRVGRAEDFFELGGDSLAATRVIARIQEALGVALPIGKFFEAPTVAGLAAAVDARIGQRGPRERARDAPPAAEPAGEGRWWATPRDYLTVEGRNRLWWDLNVHLWKSSLEVTRWYRRTLGRHTRVIAVTGTHGKTTTTRAVKAALGVAVTPWTDANANCYAFVPQALARHGWRPPHAVVEVGIGSPGQMRRYARALRPDVAVVTSIGTEHLQAFRDQAHLRDEKAELVRALSGGATAVLNGDDEQVSWIATQTHARVVTFGESPECDVRATDVALDWPHGTRFVLHVDGVRRPMRVKLIGARMVHTALAAVAVAWVEGRNLEDAIRGLEALPPTRGRMQPVPLPNGSIVLRDDYKSTIDTVHAALDVLEEVPARRRVVVLGDLDAPPPPERPHYRRVGARLGRMADVVLFVGAKSRAYRVGIARSGGRPPQLLQAQGMADAISTLRDILKPGDVVLVKGRESQRLARVVLGLAGSVVRCERSPCSLHLTFCDDCSLLTRS